MKRMWLAIISILLAFALAVNFSGCATVKAEDLMQGIIAREVSGKDADDAFKSAQMRFSVDLFRSTVAEGENTLISPLSVQLALAMTANGADGETKREMEKLLGGDISIEELNEYLYSYVGSLLSGEDCKLEIANSIWIRDGKQIKIEDSFLQTNADYYGAGAYKSAFDEGAVEDINSWVSDNTDGMIDGAIDEINPNTIMYLINALVFDAEWDEVYEKEDIDEGTFTAVSGERRTVDMMRSSEVSFLSDGKAKGFLKDYKDMDYSFAALLPNEDVDIYDYIKGLTGKGLLKTLNGAEAKEVRATTPMFSYEYDLKMKNALQSLGMPSAFDADNADFSKMGNSSRGNIYIGDVLHKTYISVDDRGTKAAAFSGVYMNEKASAPLDYEVVTLNRPFVYMILDNATSLPVFIGAVVDIEK